jgi:hypothetical protein
MSTAFDGSCLNKQVGSSTQLNAVALLLQPLFSSGNCIQAFSAGAFIIIRNIFLKHDFHQEK